MRPSRGMGALAPGKLPKPRRREDGEPVPSYAEGNWVAGAISKPGALRSALGVPKGEKVPAKKLAKAASAPGKMGQRARLAQTLRGFK